MARYKITTDRGTFVIGSATRLEIDPTTGSSQYGNEDIFLQINQKGDSLIEKIQIPSEQDAYNLWAIPGNGKAGFNVTRGSSAGIKKSTYCDVKITASDWSPSFDNYYASQAVRYPEPPDSSYHQSACDAVLYTFLGDDGELYVAFAAFKAVGIPPRMGYESFFPADNKPNTVIRVARTIPWKEFVVNVLNNTEIEIPDFPGNDNTDDPKGGNGDGPDAVEDDPIEIPGDPSLSAANAGLLTLYTPTLSQIHNLGSYLWSDSFSLDTFKKLFSDPMEAIIGLSVVPVSVPTSGAQNIVIGVTDSGVSANRAASQYVTVDCGTISVKPTWNTAIDFEPYTKFSVFLPFIGTREISTDDIMGKDVNIKYLVDVFSGACTAHIKVGGSVLYQFSGSCTTPIPISALSWSNLVTSSIGLLAGGTAAAAAGGVAGGVALAAMTAGAVARSKPTIQRAGNVSGAAGMLGVRVPYLIRETPRQSLAKDYNKFVGYPSNITSKLSDLNGYTQVENVHLEGIPATGDELSEIESLLKEGVIL